VTPPPSLPQNQVLEWASHYVDYKDLKKLVSKAASEARAKEQQKADLTDFLRHFERDLENVGSFYGSRYVATRRRLSILKDRFGSAREILQAEMRELLWALLKMRREMENLLWFGEVNRKAFIRITRSSAVKIPHMCDLFIKLESRVDDKSFAKGVYAAQLLVEIGEWLAELKSASRIEEQGEQEAEAAEIRKWTVDERIQDVVPFEEARAAIKADDGKKLQSALDGEDVASSLDDVVLRGFLQQAISARSKACTALLLSRIQALDEPDEINQRNCLHRMVLQLASTSMKIDSELNKPPSPRLLKPGPPKLTTEQSAVLEMEASDRIEFLAFVFDSLSVEQRQSVKTKDVFGRMPLHYAVRFGLLKVTELLVARMEEWELVRFDKGIDGPEWHDEEGYAPIHLAVISNFPIIARVLVNGKRGGNGEDVRRLPFYSGEILILATKFEASALVSLLLKAGVDAGWQNRHGESALLVAARLGYVSCVEALLEGGTASANLEVSDKVFGRSPLLVAAVYGHYDVVVRLLEAGADPLRTDKVGWAAKEHASFRGYPKLADRLAEAEVAALESRPGAKPVEDKPIDTLPSLAERKTFNHLCDESVVVVSLGSLIPSKNVKPVVLDTMPLTGKHISGFATALSLSLSARDPSGVLPAHASASGESTTIDLPILEELSTRPELFYTKHPDQVTVYFDIVPTYPPTSTSTKTDKLGRAVANLSKLLQSVGPTRTNLHKEVSVPILAADLEIMGSVTFSFQIIRSFSHPSIPRGPPYFWRTPEPMIIGHRGLGMNMPAKKRLQIGENTIDSFRAAGQLGAHYIEFDVQLSKDGVPIVYHDLLVTESGVDAPVFNMTAQGFNHLISDTQRSRGRGEASPTRHRSRSFGYRDDRAELEENRIKFSEKMQSQGFKANTRGKFIQASFTTLAEVLQKMPPDLGINIELKYPDLTEVDRFKMDAYAVELNILCDAVLETVFDNMSSTTSRPSSSSSNPSPSPTSQNGLSGANDANGANGANEANEANGTSNGNPNPRRRIVFSSFSPDVCKTLRFKQSAIPVMFLSDASVAPDAPFDVRSSSLQEAISFAKRWDLIGVVAHSPPLVTSPRLVRAVKQRDLVVLSYGSDNTDSALVKVSWVDHGVDASGAASRADLGSRPRRFGSLVHAPFSSPFSLHDRLLTTTCATEASRQRHRRHHHGRACCNIQESEDCKEQGVVEGLQGSTACALYSSMSDVECTGHGRGSMTTQSCFLLVFGVHDEGSGG
jgi:glycerophosphodiester phosphodiesterase